MALDAILDAFNTGQVWNYYFAQADLDFARIQQSLPPG
jgi:hypothetical protein